jgi:AraC-like DNA-binding protein
MPRIPNDIELVTVFEKRPELPVVLCVPGNADGCKAIAILSRFRLCSVLVNEVDQDLDKMSAALKLLEHAETIEVRVLRRLNLQLISLPSTVRDTVHRVVMHPEKYLTAHDIALDAEVSVATLHRLFGNAGLRSPKRVLIAARMVAAYKQLRIRGQVGAVSNEVGYKDGRVFASHCNTVLGSRPSRVRYDISVDAAVDLIAKFATAPPH